MIFDGLNEVYWEGLWTLEKWLSRIWSEGPRGEAILTLPAGTVPFFLYSTNQSGVYFGNRSFRVVPAFRGLKHSLYGIRKLRRSTVYDISDNANEKTSVLFSGFWDGGSRIERQSTEKEVSRPHDHSYRRIMNYRRRICPPRCTTRDVFKRVKCFSL